MEVYLKKEKKMEVSIIKEGRKKTEIYIKKMEVYINKKRWMKDKRWIKDGNRPSVIFALLPVYKIPKFPLSMLIFK